LQTRHGWLPHAQATFLGPQVAVSTCPDQGTAPGAALPAWAVESDASSMAVRPPAQPAPVRQQVAQQRRRAERQHPFWRQVVQPVAAAHLTDVLGRQLHMGGPVLRGGFLRDHTLAHSRRVEPPGHGAPGAYASDHVKGVALLRTALRAPLTSLPSASAVGLYALCLLDFQGRFAFSLEKGYF
jgi:hypothetical protein